MEIDFSFLYYYPQRNRGNTLAQLRFFNADIPVYPRGGPYSRKITFSRGETSINFAVLLISRGRTPREKFQDSVARRLRAEWGARAAVPPLFCFH